MKRFFSDIKIPLLICEIHFLTEFSFLLAHRLAFK